MKTIHHIRKITAFFVLLAFTSVQTSWAKPEVENVVFSPIIFHVQSAHAQPQAAFEIEKTIHALQKKHGTRLVLVEGASGALHPELLDFFPDAKKNREFLEVLTQKGELTGADLAILGPKLRGVGVESVELYNQAFDAFKQADALLKEGSRWIEARKSKLDVKSSRVFSPEFRKLFETWQKYQDDHRDLSALGTFLAQEAKKTLSINFNDPFNQFEWPQTVRFVFLQELEKRMKGRGTKKEKRAFKIIQDEIDAAALFAEFDKIFQKLFRAKSRSKEEIRLLWQYKTLRFLRKFLKLELNRPEWEKVKKMISKKKLPGVFRSAARFYGLSELRETAFYENLKKEMAASGDRTAILVTGGFHGQGMEQILREKGMEYVSILPRFHSLEDPALYRQIMLRRANMDKRGFTQLAGQGTSDFNDLGSELRIVAESFKQARGAAQTAFYFKDRKAFLNKRSELRSDADLAGQIKQSMIEKIRASRATANFPERMGRGIAYNQLTSFDPDYLVPFFARLARKRKMTLEQYTAFWKQEYSSELSSELDDVANVMYLYASRLEQLFPMHRFKEHPAVVKGLKNLFEKQLAAAEENRGPLVFRFLALGDGHEIKEVAEVIELALQDISKRQPADMADVVRALKLEFRFYDLRNDKLNAAKEEMRRLREKRPWLDVPVSYEFFNVRFPEFYEDWKDDSTALVMARNIFNFATLGEPYPDLAFFSFAGKLGKVLKPGGLWVLNTADFEMIKYLQEQGPSNSFRIPNYRITPLQPLKPIEGEPWPGRNSGVHRDEVVEVIQRSELRIVEGKKYTNRQALEEGLKFVLGGKVNPQHFLKNVEENLRAVLLKDGVIGWVEENSQPFLVAPFFTKIFEKEFKRSVQLKIVDLQTFKILDEGDIPFSEGDFYEVYGPILAVIDGHKHFRIYVLENGEVKDATSLVSFQNRKLKANKLEVRGEVLVIHAEKQEVKVPLKDLLRGRKPEKDRPKKEKKHKDQKVPEQAPVRLNGTAAVLSKMLPDPYQDAIPDDIPESERQAIRKAPRELWPAAVELILNAKASVTFGSQRHDDGQEDIWLDFNVDNKGRLRLAKKENYLGIYGQTVYTVTFRSESGKPTGGILPGPNGQNISEHLKNFSMAAVKARSEMRSADNDYQIARLSSEDPQAQSEALESLHKYLFLSSHKDERSGLVARILEKFPQVTDDALWELPSFHPDVRALLMAILMQHAWVNPGVRERFLRMIQKPSPQDAKALRMALQGWDEAFDRKGFTKAPINEHIKLWIEAHAEDFFTLFSNPNKAIVTSAFQILFNLLGYRGVFTTVRDEAVYLDESEIGQETRLALFESLLREHQDPWVKMDAAKILWILKRPVPEDYQKLFTRLEETHGTQLHLQVVREAIEKLRAESAPADVPKLDVLQMAELYRQIREEGGLPDEVLGEMFDRGKKIIFINPAQTMVIQKGLSKGLMKDVLALAQRPEKSLTHFALPLPPRQKENLEEAFKLMETSPAFLVKFMLPEPLSRAMRERMGHFVDTERVLNFLKELREKKVELVLYGSEAGLTGENNFDSQRLNLLNFLKANPEARTLVYGTFSTGQFFSREDLSHRSGNLKDRSLVKALVDAGLDEKTLASISAFETNEVDWMNGQAHNLNEFLSRYPILSSFGLLLGLSTLTIERLLFSRAFQQFYGQAWDVIIFYTKNDDRNRAFFIRRTAPEEDSEKRDTEETAAGKEALAGVRSELRTGKIGDSSAYGVYFSDERHSRFLPISRKMVERIEEHLAPDFFWSHEKGLTTDKPWTMDYLDKNRDGIKRNIEKLEARIGRPVKMALHTNIYHLSLDDAAIELKLNFTLHGQDRIKENLLCFRAGDGTVHLPIDYFLPMTESGLQAELAFQAVIAALEPDRQALLEKLSARTQKALFESDLFFFPEKEKVRTKFPPSKIRPLLAHSALFAREWSRAGTDGRVQSREIKPGQENILKEVLLERLSYSFLFFESIDADTLIDHLKRWFTPEIALALKDFAKIGRAKNLDQTSLEDWMLAFRTRFALRDFEVRDELAHLGAASVVSSIEKSSDKFDWQLADTLRGKAKDFDEMIDKILREKDVLWVQSNQRHVMDMIQAFQIEGVLAPKTLFSFPLGKQHGTFFEDFPFNYYVENEKVTWKGIADAVNFYLSSGNDEKLRDFIFYPGDHPERAIDPQEPEKRLERLVQYLRPFRDLYAKGARFNYFPHFPADTADNQESLEIRFRDYLRQLKSYQLEKGISKILLLNLLPEIRLSNTRLRKPTRAGPDLFYSILTSKDFFGFEKTASAVHVTYDLDSFFGQTNRLSKAINLLPAKSFAVPIVPEMADLPVSIIQSTGETYIYANYQYGFFTVKKRPDGGGGKVRETGPSPSLKLTGVRSELRVPMAIRSWRWEIDREHAVPEDVVEDAIFSALGNKNFLKPSLQKTFGEKILLPSVKNILVSHIQEGTSFGEGIFKAEVELKDKRRGNFILVVPKWQKPDPDDDEEEDLFSLIFSTPLEQIYQNLTALYHADPRYVPEPYAFARSERLDVFSVQFLKKFVEINEAARMPSLLAVNPYPKPEQTLDYPASSRLRRQMVRILTTYYEKLGRKMVAEFEVNAGDFMKRTAKKSNEVKLITARELREASPDFFIRYLREHTESETEAPVFSHAEIQEGVTDALCEIYGRKKGEEFAAQWLRATPRSELRSQTAVLQPNASQAEAGKWFRDNGIMIENGTINPKSLDLKIPGNPWKLDYGIRPEWTKELLYAVGKITDKKSIQQKEAALRVMAKHNLQKGPLPLPGDEKLWDKIPVVPEIAFSLKSAPKLAWGLNGPPSVMTFNLIPGENGEWSPVLIKTVKNGRILTEALFSLLLDRAGLKELVGVVNLPDDAKGLAYRIIPSDQPGRFGDELFLDVHHELFQFNGVPPTLQVGATFSPSHVEGLEPWADMDAIRAIIRLYNQIYEEEKKSARSEMRRQFHVDVQPDMGYDVSMARDVFKPGNSAIPEALKAVGATRVLFVVDEGVGPRLLKKIEVFSKQVGIPASFLSMPGGEKAKDGEHGLANVDKITRAAEDIHVSRKDAFVIVGGGALLDVAGYAASIFHRGVPYIRVPTTLLGQIDAGIGVKTGINYYNQKNFYGAFYPAKAVLIDPFLLNNLDERQMRSGMAEAVKVSLMKDAAYFELIEKYYQDLLDKKFFEGSQAEEIMWRSVTNHLEQIKTDPFERKLARPLDYGHEWGHRLEAVTHYGITHGEGVAIGMAIDTHISFQRGYISADDLERVLKLLENIGLPIYHEQATSENLWPGLESFRRHLGGKLTISLLGQIGVKKDVHRILKKELSAALEFLQKRTARSELREDRAERKAFNSKVSSAADILGQFFRSLPERVRYEYKIAASFEKNIEEATLRNLIRTYWNELTQIVGDDPARWPYRWMEAQEGTSNHNLLLLFSSAWHSLSGFGRYSAGSTMHGEDYFKDFQDELATRLMNGNGKIQLLMGAPGFYQEAIEALWTAEVFQADVEIVILDLGGKGSLAEKFLANEIYYDPMDIQRAAAIGVHTDEYFDLTSRGYRLKKEKHKQFRIVTENLNDPKAADRLAKLGLEPDIIFFRQGFQYLQFGNQRPLIEFFHRVLKDDGALYSNYPGMHFPFTTSRNPALPSFRLERRWTRGIIPHPADPRKPLASGEKYHKKGYEIPGRDSWAGNPFEIKEREIEDGYRYIELVKKLEQSNAQLPAILQGTGSEDVVFGWTAMQFYEHWQALGEILGPELDTNSLRSELRSGTAREWAVEPALAGIPSLIVDQGVYPWNEFEDRFQILALHSLDFAEEGLFRSLQRHDKTFSAQKEIRGLNIGSGAGLDLLVFLTQVFSKPSFEKLEFFAIDLDRKAVENTKKNLERWMRARGIKYEIRELEEGYRFDLGKYGEIFILQVSAGQEYEILDRVAGRKVEKLDWVFFNAPEIVEQKHIELKNPAVAFRPSDFLSVTRPLNGRLAPDGVLVTAALGNNRKYLAQTGFLLSPLGAGVMGDDANPRVTYEMIYPPKNLALLANALWPYDPSETEKIEAGPGTYDVLTGRNFMLAGGLLFVDEREWGPNAYLESFYPGQIIKINPGHGFRSFENENASLKRTVLFLQANAENIKGKQIVFVSNRSILPALAAAKLGAESVQVYPVQTRFERWSGVGRSIRQNSLEDVVQMQSPQSASKMRIVASAETFILDVDRYSLDDLGAFFDLPAKLLPLINPSSYFLLDANYDRDGKLLKMISGIEALGWKTLNSQSYGRTMLGDGTGFYHFKKQESPRSELRHEGEQLKKMRNHLGMSRAQLAKELNPEEPVVWELFAQWEDGRKPLPFGTMDKAKAIMRSKEGERLRKMRELLGMTQEAFAKELNFEKPVDRKTVNRWESGKSPVPEKIMAKAKKIAMTKAGARLKGMREHIGMSRAEFGKELNPETPVHWDTVALWENSKKVLIPFEIMVKAEKIVKLKAGERLRKMRELLEMSRPEFGKALDPKKPVHVRTIENWEAGRNPVSGAIMNSAKTLVSLAVTPSPRAELRLMSLKTYLSETGGIFPLAWMKTHDAENLRRILLDFGYKQTVTVDVEVALNFLGFPEADGIADAFILGADLALNEGGLVLLDTVFKDSAVAVIAESPAALDRLRAYNKEREAKGQKPVAVVENFDQAKAQLPSGANFYGFASPDEISEEWAMALESQYSLKILTAKRLEVFATNFGVTALLESFKDRFSFQKSA